MIKDMAEMQMFLAAEVSQIGCIVQDLARQARHLPAPAPAPLSRSHPAIPGVSGFLRRYAREVSGILVPMPAGVPAPDLCHGPFQGFVRGWVTMGKSFGLCHDRPNSMDNVTFVEDVRRVSPGGLGECSSPLSPPTTGQSKCSGTLSGFPHSHHRVQMGRDGDEGHISKQTVGSHEG